MERAMRLALVGVGLATLLVLVAAALLARAAYIFPWPLLPNSSLLFGWVFLGAAVYFVHGVLRKRPYLRPEWCVRVLENPIRVERQENNRFRFWAAVPELEGRFLRVVTLDDTLTIHNAFPDRGFKL